MELKAGYKQTEVGLIPADWVVKKIQDFGKWKGGTTPSMKNASFWVGGTIPWASSGDIKSSIIVETELHITEDALRQTSATLLPKDSVLLVVRSGILRKYLPVAKNEVPLAINQDLKAVIMNGIIDSEYLLQALLAKGSRILSTCLKTGTTVESIDYFWLRTYAIPFPPLMEEQRAIAAALSDVDALITALDRLIAKKRDIKKAAVQDLLTGKRRLAGFTGEWKAVNFADVADKNTQWSITGGPFGSNLKASDYVSEGVRIIQLQNIGDGVFHDNYAIYTTEQKAEELLSCNIFSGEIILSKMGDPVARACFVPETDHRYLMASDGIRLVPDKMRFDKRFVHGYINSNYFRKKAIESSTGSTRQRIGLEDLKRLPFAQPPLSEQTAIANIFSDMDAEIAALEKRREKTYALKQGMMQELLT